MPVHLIRVVVGFRAELHVGHLFQPQHLAAGQRADDQIAELFGRGETSPVFHRVLVGVVVVLAESSRCRLDILPLQHGGNIAGNKFVLRHLFGFHPDAHAVVGSELLHVAHAADSLDAGLDVDFHVVVQELPVELVRGGIEGDALQFGLLLLGRRHPDADHLGGQQAEGGRYAVLHVHGGHVRIGSLTEIDVYRGISCVRCRRGNVVHVLHSVDGLLQRHDDGFLHSLGVRSRIICEYLHRRRGDIGILLHRQRCQRKDAHQHDDD